MIYFRAPDPDGFTSGGNLYNRHLASSLQALSQEVIFQDCAFGLTAQHDVILWDSLFLAALLEAQPAIVGQSILIVHSDPPAFYQHLPVLVGSSLRFILPGQYMVDVLIRNGVSPNRCLLVEPGFDGEVTRASSVEELPVKLIMVANLTADKGILDFLMMIQSAPRVHPESVILHIYGDDTIDTEYAAQCHHALEHKNVNRWITYQGVEPHARMMEKLGDYHAMLSVSPKETFGMAIREARMAKMPVLAMQGGNISNLIQHEVDGVLFPSIQLLVEYLSVQCREPENFLQSLQSIYPRKITAPSWLVQARSLLSWL